MQEQVIFFTVQLVVFWWLLWRVSSSAPKKEGQHSLHEYLFNRSAKTGGLGKKDLTWTAVASYFQAATALILGFEYGYYYGLLIVLTSLFFGVGIFLFWYTLPKSNDGENAILQKAKFPFDIILAEHNHISRLIINILIYAVIPFTAVIELWYGTSLVESIFVGIHVETGPAIAGFESIFGLFVYVLISLVMVLYVYIGGYRSIVATDKTQVLLIFVMLCYFVFGGLTVVKSAGQMNWPLLFLGAQGSQPSTSALWLVAFVIGSITLNGLWQFVEPQQWHRAATATNLSSYKKSLPVVAITTCLLWGIPALLGSLFAGYEVSGEGLARITAQPFIACFQLFASNSFGLVVLSIACSGVIAAALSSADTVIMAFIARIATLLGDSSSFDFKKARALSVFLSFIVILVAWVLYFTKPQIVNVIFALFPAQLFFFGFFWTYIRNGGWLQLRSNAVYGVVLGYLICLFGSFSMSIFPTIWPDSIQASIPTVSLVFPVIIVIIGIGVCKISVNELSSE